MADWWDQNNLGFLQGDQVDKPVYSGGSGSFDEKATNGASVDAGAGSGNTGPAATTNAQKSGNVKQDWQAFIASKGYTGAQARTQMAQMASEFNAAYGYNVKPGNPNASGQTDTLDFGDGSGLRDIIHGGDNAWQDIPDSSGGGSSGGGGGNQYSGMGASQQELQSYGVPANQYASHAYTGGYQAPQWNQSFTAPTDVTMQNDPGYQFRMKMGQQALERSAAAKGTILNGGTQQATAEYGQNFGSNEYANVFQRAFDQYKQKYGEFQDAANLGLKAEQNQYGEYLGEQNRTLSDYLTNYNIGRTGVQDFLGQQNKTADRGLSATLGGKP
jgi:hypothetical protein